MARKTFGEHKAPPVRVHDQLARPIEQGHRPECRAAIYRGTRFEADWPTDPERCDLSCRPA